MHYRNALRPIASTNYNVTLMDRFFTDTLVKHDTSTPSVTAVGFRRIPVSVR